jgi:hypothetical protein
MGDMETKHYTANEAATIVRNAREGAGDPRARIAAQIDRILRDNGFSPESVDVGSVVVVCFDDKNATQVPRCAEFLRLTGKTVAQERDEDLGHILTMEL